MTVARISQPYLLYTGDGDLSFGAKTAEGVLYWRPEACVGQRRLPAGEIDLGLPFLSFEDAVEKGARTVMLGVANRGGVIPDSWIPDLVAAVENGLDIASGMHRRLSAIAPLAEAAARHGRSLHDVRHWSGGAIPVATGRRRTGRRVLMIGTDCAIGKKFSALAIHRAMVDAGYKATFRATGQTGIMISGEGIAIDALPGDFISGAVEMMTPANDPDHWDVIEGQATVLHPSFAGVTVGLVHGAQPDAMVLCHNPMRTHVRGLEERPLPTLGEAITAHETCARVTNPAARVVAISLDTHDMAEDEARQAIEHSAAATGLPASDPLRFDPTPIVSAITSSVS